MTESNQSWNFDELSLEARRTAERAAEAAGMPLDSWLNQLIKYVSAMELKGEAPVDGNGLNETIEALAKAKNTVLEPAAPTEIDPSDDRRPEDRRPDDLLPGEEPWPGDDIALERGAAYEADGPFEANVPRSSDPPLRRRDSDHEAMPYDVPPPTVLALDLLSPSRFEEGPPLERDIESAIDGWRRAGSLLPVVVRPDGRQPRGHGNARYEIVAGAERWHAAKRLKMAQVPVAVTTVSDDELLHATLIERLRRRSLSPIEESRIYRRILSRTGRSIAGLATDIGCAPSLIIDGLQLLELPDPVQEMLEEGKLTVLHARALLQADDAEALAHQVVARQLDIYQTEQLVRTPVAPSAPAAGPAENVVADTVVAETVGTDNSEIENGGTENGETESGLVAPGEDAAAPDAPDAAEIRMVEKNLSNLLGVKVSIDGGESAGVLSLHYANKRVLRDLVTRLNRQPAGS